MVVVCACSVCALVLPLPRAADFRGDRDYYMGDPDFVDVPTQGLLNRSYAEARRDSLMKVAVRRPHLPPSTAAATTTTHHPLPSIFLDLDLCPARPTLCPAVRCS